MIFALVILEALWSGFYDRDKKTLSGWFQMGFLCAVLGVMLLDYTWLIVPAYILVRFALFDLVYNLIRGVDWWFIGSTKPIDRFWQWFFFKTGFPINHFFFWTKLISLIIGVSLWLH